MNNNYLYLIINELIFIYYLHIHYSIIIHIFAFMITTTTLRLDDKVKKAASETAKDKQVRGGLSGLVESLLKEYLIKEKVKIPE